MLSKFSLFFPFKRKVALATDDFLFVHFQTQPNRNALLQIKRCTRRQGVIVRLAIH